MGGERYLYDINIALPQFGGKFALNQYDQEDEFRRSQNGNNNNRSS